MGPPASWVKPGMLAIYVPFTKEVRKKEKKSKPIILRMKYFYQFYKDYEYEVENIGSFY